MVNLPHSPATITTDNLVKARQTAKPVEDIITGRLVGLNAKSGELVIQDGGGNIYNVQNTLGNIGFTQIIQNGRQRSAAIVGQSVIVSRSRSQSGERTIRIISVVPLGKQPSDILGQLPNQGNINDLCVPTALGNTNFTKTPPEEPEDPSTQDNPVNNPDPEEPAEEDPPSEPPTGCQPSDSAQWFNGSSCPADTNNLGFADLPDGSTMTLCESPSGNTPPGDGCPETPDLYGYTCTSTGCVLVPNGQYVTQAECETACSEENEEDPDNEETGPEDPPLPDEPDPPFEGGQCEGVLYTISIDWTQERSDGSSASGTTTVTNRPGPISEARVDRGSINPDRVLRRFITDANGPSEEGSVGATTFPVTIVSFTSGPVSVTRQDGNSDDCGNPEP